MALAQQRPEEDPSQVMKAAVSAAMGKLVILLSCPSPCLGKTIPKHWKFVL